MCCLALIFCYVSSASAKVPPVVFAWFLLLCHLWVERYTHYFVVISSFFQEGWSFAHSISLCSRYYSSFFLLLLIYLLSFAFFFFLNSSQERMLAGQVDRCHLWRKAYCAVWTYAPRYRRRRGASYGKARQLTPTILGTRLRYAKSKVGTHDQIKRKRKVHEQDGTGTGGGEGIGLSLPSLIFIVWSPFVLLAGWLASSSLFWHSYSFHVFVVTEDNVLIRQI